MKIITIILLILISVKGFCQDTVAVHMKVRLNNTDTVTHAFPGFVILDKNKKAVKYLFVNKQPMSIAFRNFIIVGYKVQSKRPKFKKDS